MEVDSWHYRIEPVQNSLEVLLGEPFVRLDRPELRKVYQFMIKLPLELRAWTVYLSLGLLNHLLTTLRESMEVGLDLGFGRSER